jgi:hypothetical protein
LFPFGKDVVSPGESPIKVESKIFDVVLTGKLQIVQVDGRASAAACSEHDVQRFWSIGMHSPLVEPVLNGKEVGLESPWERACLEGGGGVVYDLVA